MHCEFSKVSPDWKILARVWRVCNDGVKAASLNMAR